MSLRLEESRSVSVHSVEQFALEAIWAFARFHAEAGRPYPARQYPRDYAWEILMMALLEDGFPPPVRLEMMREDLSPSFSENRMLAKIRSPSPRVVNYLRNRVVTRPQSQSTLSATTLIPQRENLLRQMATPVTSLKNTRRITPTEPKWPQSSTSQDFRHPARNGNPVSVHVTGCQAAIRRNVSSRPMQRATVITSASLLRTAVACAIIQCQNVVIFEKMGMVGTSVGQDEEVLEGARISVIPWSPWT